MLKKSDKNPDFLGEYVVDDMMDRLDDIKKKFEHAIALGGVTNNLTKKLEERGIQVTRTDFWEMWTGKPKPAIIMDDDNPKLEDESCDLVVAPLTLYQSNNPKTVLECINKALKPDGLFLGALPGPNTLNELKMSLIEAETEVRGGAAQRVDSFIELSAFGMLLQQTGFALVVTDTDTVTARYDNPKSLVDELRGMGVTNVKPKAGNPPLNKKIYKKMSEIYSKKYQRNGRIEASFQIMFGSGWKPHHSQQKPLKPGSATQSLAEALQKGHNKMS